MRSASTGRCSALGVARRSPRAVRAGRGCAHRRSRRAAAIRPRPARIGSRRDLVALAEPEGQHVVAAHAGVGDFADLGGLEVDGSAVAHGFVRGPTRLRPGRCHACSWCGMLGAAPRARSDAHDAEAVARAFDVEAARRACRRGPSRRPPAAAGTGGRPRASSAVLPPASASTSAPFQRARHRGRPRRCRRARSPAPASRPSAACACARSRRAGSGKRCAERGVEAPRTPRRRHWACQSATAITRPTPASPMAAGAPSALP